LRLALKFGVRALFAGRSGSEQFWLSAAERMSFAQVAEVPNPVCICKEFGKASLHWLPESYFQKKGSDPELKK
jgi:hypothetical protein